VKPPEPKIGDLRIRQTDSNFFFVEEYKLSNYSWDTKQIPRWEHIYIYKESGQIHRAYADDHDQCNHRYTNLEDAKKALKRRSDVIYTERYRQENYINVYYPTEFKKEKFNEPK